MGTFQNPAFKYLQRNTHDNPIRILLDFGPASVNSDGSAIIKDVFIDLQAGEHEGGIILQNVQVIPTTLNATINPILPNETIVRIATLSQRLQIICDVISPLPVSTETDINDITLQVTIASNIYGPSFSTFPINVQQPLIMTSFNVNVHAPLPVTCGTTTDAAILYTMNFENRGKYPLTYTLKFNPNSTNLGAITANLVPGIKGWNFINGEFVKVSTVSIPGTPNFNNPIRKSEQIIIKYSVPLNTPSDLYPINQGCILTGTYPNGFVARSSASTSLQTQLNVIC